jgi:predicted enzyme related to lactoylglutathione lyase
MPRVSHFEIHADNPERAIDFYTKVFGWNITRWTGAEYWLVKTGPEEERGIDGGLLRRHGPGPADGQAVNSYVCTIVVPNLDEYQAKVTANKGTIALPKMPVPTVGWLAYFKDTEGNIFGLMQPDSAAK